VTARAPDTPEETLKVGDSGQKIRILSQILEFLAQFLPEITPSGLTDTFENLVVLRSFSKAHGLAGIRAGYGILPPQLTVPLDNITHPYICSCPARAVAQAAADLVGPVKEQSRPDGVIGSAVSVAFIMTGDSREPTAEEQREVDEIRAVVESKNTDPTQRIGIFCGPGNNGGDGIAAARIKDPSLHNWLALALAVRGEGISDFPICNKSFNLSYCGHDL